MEFESFCRCLTVVVGFEDGGTGCHQRAASTTDALPEPRKPAHIRWGGEAAGRSVGRRPNHRSPSIAGGDLNTARLDAAEFSDSTP